MRRPAALLPILALLATLCVCCQPAEPPPFQEVIDLGLEKYLGTVQPASITGIEDGATQIEFDVADGPVCLRGDSFRAATRPGSGSGGELMIYLQGGGACWSTVCQSFATALSGVPPTGILSTTLEANPVRDWDVGYVPYCDGSLFAGDTEIDDDGDGAIDRYHRGLQNLSAALDAIHSEFPEPSRIFLTGISAGAYGTVLSAMLTRSVWPDVPMDVIADAGIGLGKPGNPGFITDLLAEWGIMAMVPPSCEDCFADGHATMLASWVLSMDPTIRYLTVSSRQDFVISAMFLGLDAQTYSWEVSGETSELEQAHPDQFARFIYEGSRHTTLAIDSTTDLNHPDALPFDGLGGQSLDTMLGRFDVVAIDGIHVARWLEMYLGGDPGFTSLVQ
jgi:hypothetical protein